MLPGRGRGPCVASGRAVFFGGEPTVPFVLSSLLMVVVLDDDGKKARGVIDLLVYFSVMTIMYWVRHRGCGSRACMMRMPEVCVMKGMWKQSMHAYARGVRDEGTCGAGSKRKRGPAGSHSTRGVQWKICHLSSPSSSSTWCDCNLNRNGILE